MSSFITQISNPPIYSSNSSGETQKIINPAVKEALSNQDTQSDWQKWYQQATSVLNQSNFYGNPSVLLNSDFYWNAGILSPVTADNAVFSEKWNVTGSGTTTFSIGYTTYSNADSDNIGSIYYAATSVTAYSGADGSFNLYQTQSGAQFLRRYQNRQIMMSAKITNNNAAVLQAKFSLSFVYNTSPTEVIQSGVLTIPQGINEIAGTLITNPLSGKTITGTPSVIFKLSFFGMTLPASFKVQYIKAELATVPTILYVDHALERSRIDNS